MKATLAIHSSCVGSASLPRPSTLDRKLHFGAVVGAAPFGELVGEDRNLMVPEIDDLRRALLVVHAANALRTFAMMLACK